MSLTAVPGVRVGHWTDSDSCTGCTVIVLPDGNVVTAEVRGAAPASRELAFMAPGMKVEEAHAICLTGGSAFGLAAADGVMSELERDGRGFEAPAGPVPIVPTAAVYDLWVGDASHRPGPAEGAAAYRQASSGPVTQGRVGAGAGATVSKVHGLEAAVPSGVGSASVEAGEATVGALAVVNAVGDVYDTTGEQLTGEGVDGVHPATAMGNTTLVVVATDAAFGRSELTRLAVRSHDALAVCIRPAHTRYDGDTTFVVSCGSVAADLDLVAEAAFAATAEAIVRAVKGA